MKINIIDFLIFVFIIFSLGCVLGYVMATLSLHKTEPKMIKSLYTKGIQ